MYSPRLLLAVRRAALPCFCTDTIKPPNVGDIICDLNDNVPGLSDKCVLSKAEPLGPGASSTGVYKVPEYYCYNKTSYHEAEVELACFRGPQPSNTKS